MPSIVDQLTPEEMGRFLGSLRSCLTAPEKTAGAVRRLADLAVHGFADLCTVYLVNPDRLGLFRCGVAHADPDLEDTARRFADLYTPDLEGPNSVVARILQTGDPVVLPAIPRAITEEILRDHPDALQVLEELDPRSYIGVPLRTERATYGVMNFNRSGSSPRSGRATCRRPGRSPRSPPSSSNPSSFASPGSKTTAWDRGR